ncbi:MAG: cupin domain-containing protein [Rhodospirillaceae bacterium]|nr:cupin domain-containing protein [Rhodospirillaceae bacterium]
MKEQNDDIVRIGNMELRFLVNETQGPGGVVMFEFTVPPNARVPAAHFHREVDEVVYGLEGTLTSTVDRRKHEICKGDSLFIGRGSVHMHENLHADTARILSVLTPGSIGRRYFEEVAAVVNAGGPPDLGRIKQIMLQHGLVPAPPS